VICKEEFVSRLHWFVPAAVSFLVLIGCRQQVEEPAGEPNLHKLSVEELLQVEELFCETLEPDVATEGAILFSPGAEIVVESGSGMTMPTKGGKLFFASGQRFRLRKENAVQLLAPGRPASR